MIHIIIECNSGSIRIDADTFDLLSDEDLETLRKIANKLKKDQMKHLEKMPAARQQLKGDGITWISKKGHWQDEFKN